MSLKNCRLAGCLLLCLLAIALGRGQQLEETWRNYANNSSSQFYYPAFLPWNRTLVHKHISSPAAATQLVCFDANGVQAWTYDFVPAQIEPKNLLVTTDNKIYFVTNLGVTAIDQDGHHLWTFGRPAGIERLTDCRLFGNNIIAVGSGRATATQVAPRTVVLSLNRFTGTLNYRREYLIGNAAFNGDHFIRSAGGYAYVFGNRNPSGTGIMKFDPPTGDSVATYAVAPFSIYYAEVDSAGQIYAVGDSVGLGNNVHIELRRINGSGTGAMPMVYRKPDTGGPLILSKGSIFTLSSLKLMKLRPSDGAVLWTKTPEQSPSYGYYGLKADGTGRIFTFWCDSQGYANPKLKVVDPATGSDLDSLVLDPSGWFSSDPAVNAYGEVAAAGTLYDPAQPNSQEGLAVQYFTPQQPVDDVYTVVQGKTLDVSGVGVLANDVFTNPTRTTVSKVTGPAQGTLSLYSNGGFSYMAKNGNAPLPVGPQTFRYRSTRQGISREAQVTINVIRDLENLTLTRPNVAGITAVSGTVAMSGVGPAVSVALQSSSALVTVPPSVNIGANKSSATFIAQTTAYVTTSTNVTLTATFGSTTRTAVLTVGRISFLAITGPTYITVDGDTEMQAVFNGPVGPGGETVTLSTSSTNFAVPPTVTALPGQTSATFMVHGHRYFPNVGGGYIYGVWGNFHTAHKIFFGS